MAMPWTEKPVAAVCPDSILWSLLAGVPIGLLFLIVAQLESKWFFFLFLGGLTLAASLAPVDRKAYYLTLLVLSLPIGVDLNLYHSAIALSSFDHRAVPSLGGLYVRDHFRASRERPVVRRL